MSITRVNPSKTTKSNFPFAVMRTRPSLRFPLTLSPAPYASFEEGWEPRARATTLPSAFSSTASQRGRKAWRRRRKRRERRRWWWRPLASVRWRRRWWRQWTGRLGPEQLEQPLAEGGPRQEAGCWASATHVLVSAPARHPALTYPSFSESTDVISQGLSLVLLRR